MEIDFKKLENKILKFWQEKNIFERSLKKNKKGKPFVFFEGPPSANALPHLGHAETRVLKDLILRYKTMRGFYVPRKAGWDTHGLPIEVQVEKELGFKTKQDIERYGAAKFNQKCKSIVWRYKKEWEDFTRKIGFWIDMENPYITYTSQYIETVWWALKEIWQKGLLYQGFKASPYCPRCGTTLSSHEVAQGYKSVKEPAVFLKFRILNPEFENSYLLVWTTTPWTLPGNVAIAVNPEFLYVKIREGQDDLILAKERIKDLDLNGEVLKEFKGKDLVNLRYQPLYPPDEEVTKRAFKVIPANFISLKEGTGLVHIAPAFGEDDMEAVKEINSQTESEKEKLPIILTVNPEGKYTLEVKKWAGLFVKEADPLIIQDLKEKNILFKEELYQHDYPFCWRCHTPLLYYAKKSWFINMRKVKNNLLANNQKINWIPTHLKKGRFGEWLKEVKDWTLSRERYWGTPLPIWQCENCHYLKAIGSLSDLVSEKFSKNNYLILRHGHSLRQVKDLASAWPEKIPLPLTEKGKKQILVLAKKLKKENIDLIFSSDLLRTKETAEIVSRETGAKIIFDKRLREYNVGIFNHKVPHLVWDFLKGKDLIETKIPKGESLLALGKRIYSFLKSIDKKYSGKNILIVSHEFPLTILENLLNGRSLREIMDWRLSPKKKVIQTAEFRRIEFKNLPFNEKLELDFHRPYIDEVKFYCPECSAMMTRTPEVIDCWFDSGSMPFAQHHYPFENKNLIEKKIQFPADFICEAIDQTRGWFYTLLAVSTLLERGPAYKNVISLGHVLDEKGEKMSKSKGNVIDTQSMIEKYGTDALRWYFYTINQPADPKLFFEKDIDKALKKFILNFWNCFLFFKTYTSFIFKKNYLPKSKNVLDKWIISELQNLILETTNCLEKYDVTTAARSIENFVVNNLSLWYIRRSRSRFQKPESKEELQKASQVLGYTIFTLAQIAAPFVPFLSEEIYRQMSGLESVHLAKWPKANKKLIDEKLNKKMLRVKEIVVLALAERAKVGIKIRQPLNSLEISDKSLKIESDLLELIKEELNVKKINFGKSMKLDTKITPKLKEEGILREVIRNIQEMRKEAGFLPQDKVSVSYQTSPELAAILEKNRKLLLKKGNFKELVQKKSPQAFDAQKEIKVENEKLYLGIKKIIKNGRRNTSLRPRTS